MTTYATGWLPDPPASGAEIQIGQSFTEDLLGAPVSDEGGIERQPWILDQEGESCTGHFGAQAIYGLTGEHCSPYLPWYFARVRDHGTQDVPNTGCSVKAFTRALREHGSCAYDMWRPRMANFETVGVHAKPTALARVDAQRRNLDIQPIYGDGASVIQAVAAALDRGFPVGVVVGATQQFKDAGETLGPRESSVRGNHIVTAWRHRKRRDGAKEVLLVNSHGYGWGSGGCTWAHESWVSAAEYLPVAKGVA